MAVETLLLSGLGTLLIALGYIIIKRLRRSNCASHTACCDCESPEIKLQKENTERLDGIMELINQLRPKPDPVILTHHEVEGPEVEVITTILGSPKNNNRGDNLTYPHLAHVGNHVL